MDRPLNYAAAATETAWSRPRRRENQPGIAHSPGVRGGGRRCHRDRLVLPSSARVTAGIAPFAGVRGAAAAAAGTGVIPPSPLPRVAGCPRLHRNPAADGNVLDPAHTAAAREPARFRRSR